MIYAYEIKNDKAVIRRVSGFGSEVELPKRVPGYPVAELGAYAFSAHIDREALRRDLEEGRLKLWDDDTGCGCTVKDLEGLPVLEGGALSSVVFPDSLKKIGAYAFYNCSALCSFSFCGGLSDLGAGLFTGCHNIKELNLTLGPEMTSCLREILIEVPEKLIVNIGGSMRARLVFPEFFEESVENTPARILMTRMHGSGMNYRNCFYAKKIDFQAYDSCFATAKAAEDFDTLLEMTLGRLKFPADLTAECRDAYETWLDGNIGTTLLEAVEMRDMEILSFSAQRNAAGVCELKKAAVSAASTGFAEGAAFLMDELKDRESKALKERKRAKRFEL